MQRAYITSNNFIFVYFMESSRAIILGVYNKRNLRVKVSSSLPLFFVQAAVTLPSRPPFHNATLMVLVTIAVGVCSLYQTWLDPGMFACAWISHHLRDGTRRGLWLAPFGSTSPLPSWLYLTAVALLPLIVRICKPRAVQPSAGVSISTLPVLSGVQII
jgi:hypothetical protein